MVSRHAKDLVSACSTASEGPAHRIARWKRVAARAIFRSLLQTERGWPVMPLDLSGEGLRHARELGVAAAGAGDIAALPFPAASFDL